jgi:phospholipase C
MSRETAKAIWWSACVACSAALLAAAHGCGSVGGTQPRPSQPKIQHVVIIFQENRSPDNLFHGLPNADIADVGVNSAGQSIPLTQIALANDYDLSHAHSAFLAMYDGGKMDGADKIAIGCRAGATNCPPPNPQFHYVNPAEVQPYFQMAEQYTFADRMFQTNQGPSFPAHQFIISGTSAPAAGSDLFAAENIFLPPNPGGNTAVGCAGPQGQTVALIDPAGSEAAKQFPCFEHPTLVDLLDSNGITWRYYAPAPGTIWTGPNAIQHLRFGPDWQNVIFPETQVLTDIGNGQLAQVTWVIPNGLSSDHPLSTDGSGPSWVASIVNAIGNSPFWSSTAILITWDDWGGWYDHVAPNIHNAYEYGFRVPLIVVSPYAKRGYVSHITHDFGSLLKFTEVNFKLPSLGYADTLADDLSDCFDFTQTPAPFLQFAAKLPATFFTNVKRPVVEPDDD